VSGTLGGKFRRRTTNKTSWDDARAYVIALETGGSWETVTAAPAAPRPVHVSPADPPRADDTKAAPSRMTVVQACKLYLDGRESAGLEPATLKKYGTFTKQITRYAESRGYVMIDQFTHVDIDLFWVNWKLGARTKGKRLTTLRGFFRFCLHRKWIAESPVSPDIRPPKGASKEANKAPFSDEDPAATSTYRAVLSS
jgi:hypothetical protein